MNVVFFINTFLNTWDTLKYFFFIFQISSLSSWAVNCKYVYKIMSFSNFFVPKNCYLNSRTKNKAVNCVKNIFFSI